MFYKLTFYHSCNGELFPHWWQILLPSSHNLIVNSVDLAIAVRHPGGIHLVHQRGQPGFITSLTGLDKENFQSKIVSYPKFSNFCVCSKEPSHSDGSFEYPQHMFWFRNKKIISLLHTLN